MISPKLDKTYWDTRHKESQTAWDIGYANNLHTDYVKANYPKNAKIIEPGAGNAHEVSALWEDGYTNVYAVDYSSAAKDAFISKNSNFPSEQYLVGDYFDIKGEFDLILEQTFFCALDPSLREAYVDKTHSLLNTGGKVMGVLFNFEKEDGPPFGGSINEYRSLFEKRFEILSLEEAKNSIPERQGNELVFELVKKT
jgi:thiopurine S-methyltransferase